MKTKEKLETEKHQNREECMIHNIFFVQYTNTQIVQCRLMLLTKQDTQDEKEGNEKCKEYKIKKEMYFMLSPQHYFSQNNNVEKCNTSC